ncbi:MAG: hypothetical protein IPN53_16830 [Comamonadaceae bacterium]|nr:hypothetical protein [Comamonadaceae bacterium]
MGSDRYADCTGLRQTANSPEFSFDASEFEKKSFEFSGYIEQKEEYLRLRGDGSTFKLTYPVCRRA